MKKATGMPAAAIKGFSSRAKWGAWLAKNFRRVEGVWVRLYKKGAGKATVTHAEALDEALCWGWIDGLGRKYDTESWILKFTPRRARSVWSKRNREHVARLMREKRMRPPGLAEVARAKADGRWDAAYDTPRNMAVPADFLRVLKKDAAGYAFFKTLNRSNTYAIAWRLQTARKPETRARRMAILLAMMRNGERLH